MAKKPKAKAKAAPAVKVPPAKPKRRPRLKFVMPDQRGVPC